MSLGPATHLLYDPDQGPWLCYAAISLTDHIRLLEGLGIFMNIKIIALHRVRV